MPTYITLANFTHQGIANVKDTTKRAEAFKNNWAAQSKRSIGHRDSTTPSPSWTRLMTPLRPLC